MATTEDVINAIRSADAAGDSASVRQLGVVLKQMQQVQKIEALKASNPGEYDPSSQEWQDKHGATSNMSTTEKVLAGAGKAFADTGRGVGQLLRKVMPDKAADSIGLPTQADIDEAKRLDAPLMKTTAGKVGNIGGSVAIALPTVFIPGAQSVAGSAAVGAGMGFIQPVASDESRLKNTLVGGALGGAAPVVARTIAAGAKGAKALVEPFTEGGRQAIAGRTLQRFGVDAADVAGATSAPTVTGATQTLAEQVAHPQAAAGAARLQDAMRAADPEVAGQFAAREASNNAARVKTLRDLAGEGGVRQASVDARQATSKDLYGKAFNDPKPLGADEYLHGGTYSGDGSSLTRPLYLTKDKGIADSYVDMSKDRYGVGDLVRVKFNGTNPAPESVINRTAKAVGIDPASGTPASVFDAELHGEEAVNRLVQGLKNNGYDHAVLGDIGYGTGTSGKATIVFPSAFPGPKGSNWFSAAEHEEISRLMQSPAIKEAMIAARTNAENSGKVLSPDGSIEGLHSMKLALDDMIKAPETAAQAAKASGLKHARDRLVAFIEQVSPGYKEARTTYSTMSQPLNQMDVAAELLKKGTSATSDLAGNPRLMPDALARAARDEGKLIKSATGRDLPQKTLSDLLTPDQLSKVQAVLSESDRAAAVARAANGPGSATAQRLASQNVLRQILGPTGLPENWAESTLLNTAMRPVQFAYNGVAEPKIQAVLADLLLNPAKTQAALQAARTAPQTLPKAVRDALPYLEQAMKTSIPAAAIAGQR